MVFLMMNTWCSKHGEDTKNLIDIFIWKVCILLVFILLDVTFKWYSLENVCVFVRATTELSAPRITQADQFYCFYEVKLDMYWENLEIKAALKFTSGHTVLTLHTDRCL